MRNHVWPSSRVTPAGTSNELDVQNEWEENTHTHCMYCIQFFWPCCYPVCGLFPSLPGSHALRFFITMQVQHSSYNSPSTSNNCSIWILLTHVLLIMLSATDARIKFCLTWLTRIELTTSALLIAGYLRTSSAQGGGGVRCQTFYFYFFPIQQTTSGIGHRVK